MAMTDAALQALTIRLDRLEAKDAIRDLACRYARCIDARDVDQLVTLFVDDIRTGPQRGRAALREFFVDLIGVDAPFTTTVHLVAGQVIDLDPDNPDRARGTVHCRAEHEVGDHWIVEAMCYDDRYERRDGTWYFKSRRPQGWYCADVLDQPAVGEKMKWKLDDAGLQQGAELPSAWPTWGSFYGEVEERRAVRAAGR
jgi:hypothetical protein